jgi:acyl-CoA dehydrogenase
LYAGLQRFVAKEVTPSVHAWDEAQAFPRELYAKAAAAGLLGLGFAEAVGGQGGDVFARLALTRALCECGSGGLLAGLMSHSIGLPPILAAGTPELQHQLAPKILSGQWISCLAVTEPGGGSDVANLRTRAERVDGGWRLYGEKVFITSGIRANVLTVAARTGGQGPFGVSIFAVVDDPAEPKAGLTRTAMHKMGWWCSDTAALHFDGLFVPESQLVGDENLGFVALMHNFNHERLGLAATAWGMAEVCYDDALAWARERETFGKPLISRQVIRHKLVEMRTRIDAVRALLEQVAWQIEQAERTDLPTTPDPPIAQVCMLKNYATEMLEWVAGQAVQILGGAGYMRGGRVERIFRETKVLSIGGGATEILNDLASRQLGY